MPQIFSTSRAEAAVFRFPPLFFPIVFALALALQAYLPVLVHAAVYLDLPLLLIIYWAITTRSPASATVLGAVLGIAQDSLSHLALGVNGIAKTIIGYIDASFGNRMDADHAGIRWLMVFGCYLLNRCVLFTFERFLLGTPIPWRGAVTTLAAAVNAVVALLLYRGMDRFRSWM
ncbi:MAG: rod shape-determining protein MreD [Terriglobales bacterium]